jgi:glutaredoxin/glutathione-dependent peroxiredoxin
MTISVGDTLPDAALVRMGADGLETISLHDKLKGRKVVIFAVPGAFTPTCHSAHVPSFMRNMDKLKAKGVDEVICISVNDAHVMRVWGETTGATAAGITMLADAQSMLTNALDMAFTAAPVGLLARSKRYALYVVDGVVQVAHLEQGTGTCEISGGEAMLAAI